MKSFQSIPLLLLACSLVACGNHSHHKKSSPPLNNTLFEIEPNGNAANADYLGEVFPGDFISIEGHIRECCGVAPGCCLDEYDGFAFYADQPVSVRITLTEFSAFADLDFAIYLPEVGAIVELFETDQHPEFGVFNYQGPGEFHIVVNSYIGDSSYLLDVDVQPLFLASDSNFAASSSTGSVSSQRAGSALARERFARYSKQDLEFPSRALVVPDQSVSRVDSLDSEPAEDSASD